MVSEYSDGSDPGTFAMDAEWPNVIAGIVVDQLRKAQLLLPSRPGPDSPDLTFQENTEFWAHILGKPRTKLRWVRLQNFQIVDWYPRSPGLYYGPMAQWHRTEAGRFLLKEGENVYYSAAGKGNMIQGGIGSIRFKPFSFNDEDYWMCSATSDEYCHRGIPLAVPDSLMARYPVLHRRFNIYAQIRFVPDFFERYFLHVGSIPQILLYVDALEDAGQAIDPVLITPAVYFRCKRNIPDLPGPSRNAVSYVVCRSDRLEAIDTAAEWLEWYAKRYDGEIVTNFDQQRPTFANAPFSLQNVMVGHFEFNRIPQLHIENADIVCESIQNLSSELTKMTQISIKLGDGTIVKGPFVVAHSIKDSFNVAASHTGNEELREFLQDLTREVGRMVETLDESTAKLVSRDLESLVGEVTSAEPRERWWKLSAEGLINAAKTAGEAGKVVLDLLGKISTFVS